MVKNSEIVTGNSALDGASYPLFFNVVPHKAETCYDILDVFVVDKL